MFQQAVELSGLIANWTGAESKAGGGSHRLCHDDPVRVSVHVRPNSRRAAVGGSHGGRLIVRVTQRPQDGEATDAALRALADAFDVPARDVTLVAGTRSRTKVVEVQGDHQHTLDRLLTE